MENDFVKKITNVIEDNLSDELFGVSELAGEIGMSRSNLLRKVKQTTNLSVSQFIRNVRLQHAKKILKESSLTVSEISYQVGFSSVSYFIKCFRDLYGYPPGEEGKREASDHQKSEPKRKSPDVKWGLIIFVAILIGFLAYKMDLFEGPASSIGHPDPSVTEKSIAVLPFINDSNDSSNVYIINGLMEAILNNLQKIEDLRVISRTSVERYRHSQKSVAEIARELNVGYLIEGSGQKIGDQIMLNIQLIDARKDQHIWSQQYNREAKDIFKLQSEVAESIADGLHAIITPAEKERIDKPPTDDPVAYDYFLQGLDLFYRFDEEGLESSVAYFKKAIEHDPEFARAYADVAIAVYLLDAGHAEKKYADTINYYADQALLHDGQLPQSLIAKALYYMYNEDYSQALPYLEKALEYNPNSATVVNALSDYYAQIQPNTAKYLEYALKGIQLDIGGKDSATSSNMYLHLSNALIQTGFVDEALAAADRSLAYNPENPYTGYVKAFIHYAKNGDLGETKTLLIREFSKDTTRLDILQEIGKIYYYQRDYERAYKYYKKLIDIKKEHNLNIYRHENAKMGLVLAKMGMTEESEAYFADFKNFAENDQSIYRHMHLALYHSYMGDPDEAIEQLRLFSQEDNYFYWILLFLKKDPLIDNIKNKPEFKKVYTDIERKFNGEHDRIKVRLEDKGVDLRG